MTSHLHEVGRQPEGEPADQAAEREPVSTKPKRQQAIELISPGAEPLWPLDQARIDKLQDAANAASGHVRNVYLTFLLFGLYLAIIFGATTHEQLLRAGPVTLPLLNVELPLLGFYWVAPALFVLLHLNLLLQLYLLAGKLHRLDAAIGPPASRAREAEAQQDWRAQLYPFPFSHMLIGRQHGRLMRSLLWLIVWLTVLVLPLLLLLFGQVRFLPYHDAATTMWHRVLVALDVLLTLIFWRPIRHPEDRLRAHRRRWLWHQGKALPGVFACLALSWLILTFPGDEGGDWGDPMEEWLLAIAPETLIERRELQITGEEIKVELMLLPTRYLFGWLPFLERNLIVQEVNLVGSWPTQSQIEQYGEDLAWRNFGQPTSLRARDLRHADLSHSILVRGDLRGASLQGAVLSGVNLQKADLRDANLERAGVPLDSTDRGLISSKGCWPGYPSLILRGADFRKARLDGALLQCSDLQGAILEEASLQRAVLVHANLQDANLVLVNLQGADLSSANLSSANLHGADLTGATLRYADLRDAILPRR